MAFKTKGKTQVEGDHYDSDFLYPYECIKVDFDTVLYRSATALQQDYILVKHKPSGFEQEFRNKTAFYGHHLKKEGGWLGSKNAELKSKGKRELKLDEFEIHELSRLHPDIENHIEYGLEQIDMFVGFLKKQKLAKEYTLLIGGKDNFRYGVAKILEYKGNRGEKPILFSELREAFVNKYKNYVEIINGREVDDAMASYGLDNYRDYLSTGKWKYILAYVDKDLDMIYSPSFNYDNIEKGIREPTPLDCIKSYCSQLIAGDLSTDNIQGLKFLPEEITTKYGIRKSKGVGKATAEKLFEGVEKVKECFEIVVECYRAFYGDDEFEFESWNGETSVRTWKDMLQETALLIRMHPEKDPLTYNILDTLDKLGIQYE